MTYQGGREAFEAATRIERRGVDPRTDDRAEDRMRPRAELKAGPLRPCRLEGKLYE